MAAPTIWQSFLKFNPWAKNFDDQSQLALALEMSVVPFKAKETLFTQGEQPGSMFWVINGMVIETAERDKTQWFRRKVGPGMAVGQYGMFMGVNPSTATADANTEALAITPAGVRILLDRSKDYFETMLHEECARRLRRIPVFSDLHDDELRLMTQVIEETTFDAGHKLPLDAKSGLWGIHWGQLVITGPAAMTRPNWRLTAGNFIISPGMAPTSSCLASGATAHVRTSTFFLGAEHVQNLASAFPRFKGMIQQPIDMVKIAHDIFDDARFHSTKGEKMGEDHFRHLAQFLSWEYTPAGQDITTQGDIGYSVVYLQEGEAVVTGMDGQGRVRPRGYLKADDDDWYGATGLLEGSPREMNVRATSTKTIAGAACVLLDRRDLGYAFAEKPDLWHGRMALRQKFKQLQGPVRRFPWLGEGEQLIWYGRKHVLWLLLRIVIVLLLALPAVILTLFFGDEIGLVAKSLMWLIVVVLSYLIINDYYDDMYVVTRDRVIRRDRFWWLYFTQYEVSTRSIEDVNSKQGFWGGIFGFGNVDIRAAVKESSMVFAQTPRPDFVRQLILTQQTGAKTQKLGQRREWMRTKVMRELRLAILASDRRRALGENVSSPRMSSRFLQALRRLAPQRWRSRAAGAAKPAATSITWRKHWLYLLQHVAVPLLLLLIFVFLMLLDVNGTFQDIGLRKIELFAPMLFLAILCLGWLIYQYADYHNDIYVLTEDRIIDIEATPLLIFRNKRESPLERIQSVNLKQEGIVANILNFGDVIIRTAATDEGFTFSFVANPRGVQAEIFRRLDVVRVKKEEQAFESWHKQMLEGLDVYYGVVESKDAGRP